MKPRLIYALVAGVAVLGAIAGYFEVSDTTAQPTDKPVASGGRVAAVRLKGPADDPASSSGNPLWAIPLKQLSIARERPIFSPSRRPPPAPVVTPVSVAPPPPPPPPKPVEQRPALSLIGAVVSADEGIGVFIETSSRNIVRLRLGEDHQGWVLRSVKPREATVEKNGLTAVLELPPPGGGGAADVAANAPRPELTPRPPRR
jgi:general secretion pathway protein N